MELFLIGLIVIVAVACGRFLASGSEQETYDALKGTPLAYEAAITAPPVEEKPWESIYSECTCSCFKRLFMW